MKNPIKIRTNFKDRVYYDVYLYQDKKLFENDLDELRHRDWINILFSGRSEDVSDLKGQVKLETHVTFFDETSRKQKFGTVINVNTTPYYEIEEDKTKFRYSVHTKHIKSTSPTFKTIASDFIRQISTNKFKKYDIGMIGTVSYFDSADKSLKDLVSKGTYAILMTSEI